MNIKARMTRKHLLLFLVVYLLLFSILFPFNRYYIDSDATGYFSVAEKIARGDYFASINGIWSPLGSWILVPFLKLGFNSVISTKLLNGIYGLVALTGFFFLLKKLKIDYYLQLAIMACSIVLVLSFSYHRLFGDFLLVTILLVYLNVICSKEFGKNYKGIILASLIAGIAFYAKAYTFYFAILHLPLTILISNKRKSQKLISPLVVKKIIVSIVVLAGISLFWFICLNLKYGEFILGQRNVSGTLNTIYNPSNIVAFPPPSGSYAMFDDITRVYGPNVTPFTNWNLFIIQIRIIISNLFIILQTFNEFSIAFCVIFITALALTIRPNNFFSRDKSNLMLFSFLCVWPIGFLLFHIESRFLWMMDFIMLALAGVFLTELMRIQYFRKKGFWLLSTLIILSFSFDPLMGIKIRFNQGKDLFEIASALKQKKIEGSWMAGNSGTNLSNSIVLNYIMRSRYYGTYGFSYKTSEVIGAIQKYHISFFVYYYRYPMEKENFLSGDLAKIAARVYSDIYPGVVVLTFNKNTN